MKVDSTREWEKVQGLPKFRKKNNTNKTRKKTPRKKKTSLVHKINYEKKNKQKNL